MKTLSTFFLLCCLTFGLVTTATSQVYFQDDFEQASESEMKWVPLFGDWQLTDGEYRQLANSVNCMSLIADEYWDEAWNNYTFELRASKVGGGEGFLILFKCLGLMQDRSQALTPHPPRMVDQPRLQYWWNIGGWGNSLSRIEAWNDGAYHQAADSTDIVVTGDWYNIKIVNTPTNYALYYNDELVAEVNDTARDGAGRVGLGTWGTMAHYDDVIVYGPDGPTPVDPKGKLATSWGHIKTDR